MSLKILLWHWGRRGGGPRYSLELARALSARSNVDIALSLSKDCEIYDSFSSLGFARFDIETYSGLGSAVLSSFRLPGVRKGFRKFVRENQIDVVICTMTHLWNVPMLIGKPVDCPVVMVLHDAVPHQGENYPFRFRLLKAEVERCEAVITLTEHVRLTLHRAYEYPEERSFVVPHGVFLYAKPVEPRTNGDLRMLFFGRILPYKGLDLLLDAHRILLDRGVNVHLKIMGTGNISQYKKAIASLDKITVENRWIGESEIENIFSDIDVTVLPYKAASQSGVIATSFAAGIPVIATSVGGLVEQVSHGKNGLICENATPESIAATIEMMANDRELQRVCASGALKTAREELSWDVIAGQFMEICNRIRQQSSG